MNGAPVRLSIETNFKQFLSKQKIGNKANFAIALQPA